MTVLEQEINRFVSVPLQCRDSDLGDIRGLRTMAQPIHNRNQYTVRVRLDQIPITRLFLPGKLPKGNAIFDKGAGSATDINAHHDPILPSLWSFPFQAAT